MIGEPELTWYEIEYPVAKFAKVQSNVTDDAVEVPQLIMLLQEVLTFTTIAALGLSHPPIVWLT